LQAILISPHPDEAIVLQVIMQQAGFMVRTTRSLEEAIEAWPENPAELILIVLTGEHSKSPTQIKSLRAHTVVPILLVSDPLPDDLLVNYLETGVDLVVIRPYSVRAMLAQIRAIMRRSPGISQQDVRLNPSDRTVQVGDGDPKRLTQLEFRLMYTLMTHVGQIIPTEQIVEYVWGYSGEGNRELVRGLVQRVRSKVEPDRNQLRYILTEPGIGYYFRR
jgi:DNA-binding response OmpR family regulator